MDTEFDKTIDALLRNVRDPNFNGDAANGIHLDADELSMFAENASPAGVRVKQSEHLANCGDCRHVLAQLISLNVGKIEPEAVAPKIQVIAETSVPWYRRLFIYPNIAYVMGSLVVIFGGLLVFSIVQSTKNSEVSMSADKFPQSGSAPAVAANRSISSNTAANSNEPEVRAFDSNMSNSNALTTQDRAVSATPIIKEMAAEPMASKDESTTDAAVGQLESAKPADRDDKFTVDGASGAENKYKVDGAETEANDKKNQAKMRAMEAPAPPPAVSMSRSAPEKKAASNESRIIGRQQYIRKQGVWYDVRYNEQPTINVRRGTSEYKKLDSGLKKVAEKLNGTAVILWKEKAYRISD